MTPTSVEALQESRNVIPDRVTVVLDWRILPDTEGEALLARVREVIGARLPDLPEGFGVEVCMAREGQSTCTGITR